MTPRSAVYRAIDDERDYQDEKFGAERNMNLEITGYFIVLENEIAEAKLAWTKGGSGRNSVMHEIRQIAATAVAAMEAHGTE
jgi:hypothetical protein